ncbi:hypothetical protein SAZ10_00700 [Mesorhizobium sp. BAC0120]|uniref:hypothetical protein n=1 Tax=Mesorhizobium sp. BAC0120 TaxID=3090670 RepID=UPI00298C59B7|nr:hypothetical protein [Mesorhizobium sp. BAC0120]MDW6020275.1 hypothetical protein [Mesorhizobium sp. BAC0120]
MTLFIQRAEHRDTQALQAKLDELLRQTERQETSSLKSTRKSPKKSKGNARPNRSVGEGAKPERRKAAYKGRGRRGCPMSHSSDSISHRPSAAAAR